MEEKTIEAIPAIPSAVMLGAVNAVIGIIFAISSTAITSSIPSGSGPPLTGLGVFFGVWR